MAEWKNVRVYSHPNKNQRWLGEEESVVSVRENWPRELYTLCRFELREVGQGKEIALGGEELEYGRG